MPYKMTIVVDHFYIRNYPSKDGDRVTIQFDAKGKFLTVYDKFGEWYKVSKIKDLWVHESCLRELTPFEKTTWQLNEWFRIRLQKDGGYGKWNKGKFD